MCDLVCDRYAVLQVMSRFGIALGFGDKTIAEVCAESRVDAATRPTSLYKGGKIPPACGKSAAQPLRSDCVGFK